MTRSSHLHALRIGTLLVALALATLPGRADPPPSGDPRPADSDLREHLRCSAEAAQRLLGPDEARACATAYTRVKLSFVPGVGLDDFNRLPPQEKAALNLVAYERYREWSSRNAAEIAGLRAALPSAAALVAR